MPHIDFTVEGAKWPSATELTAMLPQPWLLNWYKREVQKHGWRGWQKCEATKNRATRIGSLVHAGVEAYLVGNPAEYLRDLESKEPPRRATHIVKMAKILYNQIDRTRPFSVEQHLVSEEFRMHGTADLIQVPSVLDWKTSNSISDSYGVQLAIYAMCWNETHPEQLISSGVINRVDKKAKKTYVQNKVYEDLGRYYPVVYALRTIWDFVNKAGSWAPDAKE